MIKSMTGYGKSEQTIDSLNVTVEIKSVNHRYFEFSARVPREYGFLEEKLKKYCNSLITRGKVECYVSVEDLEEREMEVNVNETLAAGYVKALKELSERFGLKDGANLECGKDSCRNRRFKVYRNARDGGQQAQRGYTFKS